MCSPSAEVRPEAHRGPLDDEPVDAGDAQLLEAMRLLGLYWADL